MKTKIISNVLLIGLILFLVGCEKTNPESHKNLAGEVLNYSSCKSGNSTSKFKMDSDTLSCVNYTYHHDQKKLVLKHINAGFNCCPGDISCRFELVGDTIKVREFEELQQCSCNCLYDLDLEIDGIEDKSYILYFIEPYYQGPNLLIFKIDLSDEATGDYCVTRNNYPWGVQ